MSRPNKKKSKTTADQAASNDLKLQAQLIKSGRLKEVLRDGRRYLEWSADDIPKETPREAWEHSESLRILTFLGLPANVDLPWPLGNLNPQIRSDNGRLRLWLEIKEDTSKREVLKHFEDLRNWKSRLIAFDKKHDPLPPTVQKVLGQIEAGQSIGQVAKAINAWIAEQMYEWENADGSRRRRIDSDVAGVLSSFGFTNTQSDEIMNAATVEIRLGKYPFGRTTIQKGDDEGKVVPRDGHPVTRDLLKSRIRKWSK